MRLVFEFDGDKKKLSFSERAAFSLAESISGRESPYATLMYIWSNKVRSAPSFPIRGPTACRWSSPRAGRAASGAWQSLSRNVREDYKRAFGEDPGRLIAYGVLTDTDNTGEIGRSLVRRHRLQAPRALTPGVRAAGAVSTARAACRCSSTARPGASPAGAGSGATTRMIARITR